MGLADIQTELINKKKTATSVDKQASMQRKSNLATEGAMWFKLVSVMNGNTILNHQTYICVQQKQSVIC